MPVTVRVKRDGRLVGRVSGHDLDVLSEALESDATDPAVFFIEPATIAVLQRAGASETLIELLRDAVGNSDGVDIQLTASHGRSN